jgi:hypothetical protein
MNRITAYLHRLRPFFPHLLTLGVAVLAGIAVGLVTAMSPPKAIDKADRWSMPKWAPYKTGPERQALTAASFWVEDPNKQKNVAAPKVVAPPWRFIGTVREGNVYLAVIELDQGKRVQRLRTGEKLPSGAPLTAVKTGELMYTEDNAEKKLTLFDVEKVQFSAGSK